LPLRPQAADEHIVFAAGYGKGPIPRDRLAAAAQRQTQFHLARLRHPSVHVQRLAGQPSAAEKQVLVAGALDCHVRDPFRRRQTGTQPTGHRAGGAHVADQVEPQPAAGVDQRSQIVRLRLGPLHADRDECGGAVLQPRWHHSLAGRIGNRHCLVHAVTDVDRQPPPPTRPTVEVLDDRTQAGVQIGFAQTELVIQSIQRRRRLRRLEPTIVQGPRRNVDAQQTHAILGPQALHDLTHHPADGIRILDTGRGIGQYQHVRRRHRRRFGSTGHRRNFGQEIPGRAPRPVVLWPVVLRAGWRGQRFGHKAAQHGRPIGSLGKGQDQIRLGPHVVLLPLKFHAAIRPRLEVHLRMRGARDGGELLRRTNRAADTKIPDRHQVRQQRQAELVLAGLGLERQGEIEQDAFFVSGENREYAHLEQIVAQLFQNGRVAAAGDDRAVDLGGPLAFDQFAFDQLGRRVPPAIGPAKQPSSRDSGRCGQFRGYSIMGNRPPDEQTFRLEGAAVFDRLS